MVSVWWCRVGDVRRVDNKGEAKKKELSRIRDLNRDQTKPTCFVT